MSEPVLDLSALRGAIASLEGALEAVGDRTWFDGQSPNVQNTLMAGAIQNFEFVYELSIKMIRRQIELDSDSPDEVDQTNFRDMLRIAAEKGLITDVEAWFFYRKMRNVSAHTYDHAKAREVYRDTLTFINDARALLAKLEARND
jgi:nucleotidyltransferase substrate binding protein (TIGR01987 family)